MARPRGLFALAVLFGAVAIAAGVAGCGFTPMYAQPGVSSGLSRVDVKIPDGRVAFLLKEALDDDLGKEKSAAPMWRLDLQVDQLRVPLGLTINDVAQRYSLTLKVRYSLSELATGQVALTGAVATEASYDTSNQPYAGIAARQDAQQRAAADAARRIQLDLAVWMSHRAKPASAG